MRGLGVAPSPTGTNVKEEEQRIGARHVAGQQCGMNVDARNQSCGLG